MGFREHLEKICASVEGSVVASVLGFDGIAIDTYEQLNEEGVDVQSLLVEYANVLSQIRSASGLLQTGGVQELIISTDRLTTLSRPLNPDYFVALALTPDGNWGKARFVLRVNAPDLAREF